MKATFPRQGLLAAFQAVNKAVATRDVKPILRNVKMVLGKDRGTLMATDLELGIRMELRGAKVEETGEAILPAARMIAILHEATDEELLLEADSDQCRVLGKSTEFEMPGEDPANFPEVPVFGDESHHELPAGVLREMIRRTIFAAATENPRYAVTGILWELEDSLARLIATDGRRLAIMQAPAKGSASTKGQTPVVPTKAMSLLESILQDAEEPVRVCLKPNEALFKTERATLYSRLVEGRYPAYREVFPKKSNAKVTLIAGPLQSAVRQAAIMTDEESKRVTFSFAKQKLTMQAKGAETGRSKVELPLEFDAKPIDINFDPKFLTDMLRVLEPDASLTVDLVDGNTPAVFKSGDNYTYVVMPLT